MSAFPWYEDGFFWMVIIIGIGWVIIPAIVKAIVNWRNIR